MPKESRSIIIIFGLLIFLAFFMYSENNSLLSKLTVGRITNTLPDKYYLPVGGTFTISYRIDTWNGVEWNWPDLDLYQYNYKVIDTDDGHIIKYGAPWRSIHSNTDSITIVMPREGTFNYALVETVDFLKEGRTMNGSTVNFKVIVGSGISPTPLPIPLPTPGAPTPVPTSVIIIEPEPTPPPLHIDEGIQPITTFNPYIPPPLSTPPITVPVITPSPVPASTPIITPVVEYTVVPTPVSVSTPLPTPDMSTPTHTTVPPVSTPGNIKETPTIPGFESALTIIALICLGIFCMGKDE